MNNTNNIQTFNILRNKDAAVVAVAKVIKKLRYNIQKRFFIVDCVELFEDEVQGLENMFFDAYGSPCDKLCMEMGHLIDMVCEGEWTVEEGVDSLEQTLAGMVLSKESILG
tara:strand:- start:3469 stop:3801 length:333 start_codon:yes stop_codon:yes gene_type:complete